MSRENLVLGEGVTLPDDVEVGANVVIHAGTVIGAGCVIQDNVVLGKTPKLASRSTAKKKDLPGLVLAEAVTMALAEKIGRAEAHEMVERASHRAIAQSLPLGEVLLADPVVTRHLIPTSLRGLLDPGQYLGQSANFTRRVLATFQARQSIRERKA